MTDKEYMSEEQNEDLYAKQKAWEDKQAEDAKAIADLQRIGGKK